VTGRVGVTALVHDALINIDRFASRP